MNNLQNEDCILSKLTDYCNKRIIVENYFFIMYLNGEDYTEFHLESKSKENQEKYQPDEVLSAEKKQEQLHEILDYFFNFWKLVESSGDTKQYTMYFNINLVLINVPMSFFGKIKNVLESLKPVLISNVTETYFKVENQLAKYFFDLILTFYTPVKPVHIV